MKDAKKAEPLCANCGHPKSRHYDTCTACGHKKRLKGCTPKLHMVDIGEYKTVFKCRCPGWKEKVIRPPIRYGS